MKAPFLTLRVATPSGAPRQAPLDQNPFFLRDLWRYVFVNADITCDCAIVRFWCAKGLRVLVLKCPQLLQVQGPLNGGVSNGGVSPIWTFLSFFLPFLSFFVLFGTFPIFLGFSRFALFLWSRDFPNSSFSSFSAY